MNLRSLLLPVLAAFFFAHTRELASADGSQVTATGQAITTDDLKNARAVRSFTPAEFMAATDAYNAKQCKKGTVRATSSSSEIVLDGVNYSLEAFGHELLKRYKTKPFYCVEITGPGGDIKIVNKLVRALNGTEISLINWKPAPAK